MLKLLIADDSITIQRVIELTFSGQDVQVVPVGDGEEAMARIAAERPDIILADIGMPAGSGYDVAAFVKRDPDLAHIPVLLLAGAFEPVDQARADQVGCDGVLVKPFEPQRLIARVREAVNGATRRISSSEGSGVGAVGSGTPNPGSGETASLDDYFDRLGAAFARLGDGAGTAAPGPPVLDEVAGGGRVPTIDDLIGGVPARRVSGEPPPSNRVDPRPGEPSGSGPGSTPPAGSAHDGPSGAHVAALLTDEIVDEVTRRVLERLAPDAVRGLVAEIVSDVAERLVREETGRIRSRT